MKMHPGIRIDKIPVRGWEGLLFVFAVVFIVFVGIPSIRPIIVLLTVLGIGFGFALYFRRLKF